MSPPSPKVTFFLTWDLLASTWDLMAWTWDLLVAALDLLVLTWDLLVLGLVGLNFKLGGMDLGLASRSIGLVGLLLGTCWTQLETCWTQLGTWFPGPESCDLDNNDLLWNNSAYFKLHCVMSVWCQCDVSVMMVDELSWLAVSCRIWLRKRWERHRRTRIHVGFTSQRVFSLL